MALVHHQCRCPLLRFVVGVSQVQVLTVMGAFFVLFPAAGARVHVPCCRPETVPRGLFASGHVFGI